jgi:glucose/arabinose dehydrogenase
MKLILSKPNTRRSRASEPLVRKGSFSFALILLAAFACVRVPGETPSDASATPFLPAAQTQLLPTESPIPEPTQPAQPGFPDHSLYEWAIVADGFRRPLFLTHAGDGSGRLFVVDQDGAIRVIENGNTLAQPFLDIDAQIRSDGNEQGLLGLAFHPDFEQNGFFYVNYTDNNGDTVISRFSVTSDPNLADPASETILLQVDQPYQNHNGGHLEFGPDGFLYAGLGDGGSVGDPHDNGQSTQTLLGKILRIDVNSGSPYAVPPDNPFAGGGGLSEIWIYGLRNPWRFSFDSATGDLYIGDVGQNQLEEIDFLPAGGAAGANLGWSYFEGTRAFQGSPPDGSNLIGPVAEYDHSGRCSVTGGYVYRGETLPEWRGVYFYADYCSGEVWGLLRNPDGTWENRNLYAIDANITSFGTDENGEHYIVGRSGALYRLQQR